MRFISCLPTAIAALLTAAFTAGCGKSSAPARSATTNTASAAQAATSLETAAYAEPNSCTVCHAEIAKSYRLTGMGRSIQLPSPANLIEDFTRNNVVAHRASGNTYKMTARSGSIVQSRDSGFEMRADFIIGSGNHARSYLARNREGKYVELPVTWYAQNGGYWAMSPGYERASQEDFRRIVPDECLFCHSSYAQPLQAIDCQRCHGPGRAHVESSGRAAILNPQRLSRERQLDLCMQCHLETTSRPLPDSIRRFERSVFSYRPGEPLTDYALYFDHAPGTGRDDKFEIAGAAYRLRKSACFQKSAMTCATCHNPHRAQSAASAAPCLQCHSAPHNPGTNCIDCHMPKRRAEDATHVVMTDHFIRKRPATSAPSKAPETPYAGEVTLYYPERLPDQPESEAYLALAQVRHGSNLAAGIPRLEAAIGKLNPSGPDFYFELGKAYSKRGDEATAARWHEEALERDKHFKPAIRGLAASSMALRQFDRAAALLAAADSPDARMLTNQAQALLEARRVNEAESALSRAAALNPDLPEIHDLWGLLQLSQGNAARAEREFREALRLQPDLASAHANLAGLLAGRKDLKGARKHFERSLSIDPNSLETHRNFGYLLILLKSYAAAQAEFEAAARVAPSRPEPLLDLAELELAQNRGSEALKRYRQALARDPDHGEANLGLGILLLEQRQPGAARSHLEKAAASQNPDIRQRASAALAALPVSQR